jgi:hypothetical protein
MGQVTFTNAERKHNRVMRHGVNDVVATLGLVVAVATCAPTPTAVRPNLGISNGTTLHVTLFVNGLQVAQSLPGGPAPVIDSGALPALPWTVEARNAFGRVLTSMKVELGQVATTTGPNGEVVHVGTMGRVDLSCGRLTIWAGDFVPSGPPPPESPGQPGDCGP